MGNILHTKIMMRYIHYTMIESDLKRLRAEGKTEKQLQQLILALSKNKKEYQEKYPQIFE